MKNLLLLIIFSICINISAQQSYYEKTFDWVVTTFEDNDAGFQSIVDRKGKDAYQAATEAAREKVKAAKDDLEFRTAVNSWLSFFRKGHIYFSMGSQYVWPEKPKLTLEQIREKYKDSPRINITEKEFKAKLKAKSNPNPLEKIWWAQGGFRIGFIPDEEKQGGFIGVVFSAPKQDSLYWTTGDILMKLSPDSENPMRYDVQMYDKERKIVNADHMEFLVEDKTLFSVLPFRQLWEIEGIKRKKKESELYEYYVFTGHNKPLIKKFNNKTTYLYINSFSFDNKQKIDALLAENDSLIRSSENLIIDIRNSSGGTDAAFENLIPYIYTSPVRIPGLKLRATELNASVFEYFRDSRYKSESDSTNYRYASERIKKIRANIGGFFNPNSTPYTDIYSKVLPYPKKIGIIVHKPNQSSDEGFISICKQSFKTKIFGHTTSGCYDASNMSSAESPDGKFVLGMTMSLRIGIENFPVDNIGFQPDFYIDPYIERFSWIDYVREVLEYS